MNFPPLSNNPRLNYNNDTSLNKLISEIENGDYNDWAIEYWQDYNNDTLTPTYDIDTQAILDPIIDFLKCRQIETEDTTK